MKSICFIVTSDQSAGFLRGYLAFLRDRGWAVTLIANDEGRLGAVGDEEGVQAISVPMCREPSPIRDLTSLIHLVGVLRSIQPDVLVYSTPKAAFLGSLAGRLLRVPVRIYELWGLRHETMRGAPRSILRGLERLIGRSSTEVIADSASLARLAEEEGIARKVVTVGAGSALGVDTERFNVAADDMEPLDDATQTFLKLHESLPKVIFVGRINRDKGVDTLIAALRILAAEDRRVAALIVGGYESEMLQRELSLAAQTLPLHVVGPVPDPRAYIVASTVLCLPTLREGFGQVIIEAASLGIPAVTTTATGARDAVVDGVTGIHVAVGAAQELADAVWQVVDDPDLAHDLGHAARARALADFDCRRVWRLHADHLDAVSGRRQ